jgi:hypothetical protein
MTAWRRSEYDRLFREHPPTEPTAPNRAEAESIGNELGRTWGGIKSQWDDGRSLILGTKTDASLALRDYLRGRGWLQRRQ